MRLSIDNCESEIINAVGVKNRDAEAVLFLWKRKRENSTAST